MVIVYELGQSNVVVRIDVAQVTSIARSRTFSAHKLGPELIESGDGMRFEVEATSAECPLEGMSKLPGQEVVEDGVYRAAQEVQHSCVENKI